MQEGTWCIEDPTGAWCLHSRPHRCLVPSFKTPQVLGASIEDPTGYTSFQLDRACQRHAVLEG